MILGESYFIPTLKPLPLLCLRTSQLAHYTKVRKDKRRILVEPQEVSDDVKFSYVTDLDDRIVLEGVLALLSEEEREIVLLYAVSGMKHKEIAESLGLKLSTTLSKYHRALKKLRDYLIGREARA